MPQVNDLGFWKERIKNATHEQYSVYLINDSAWEVIEEAHKDIIQKVCKGKILDAGCGYGRLSPLAKDYVGIDFSPDFIEKAKSKYPDKDFRVADLRDLPFKDKEFDWAVCASIRAMIVGNLGYEEWNKMEKELKRVAKQILCLEYTNPEQYEII